MYWKRALHSQASDFKTVVLIPYKKAFDLKFFLDKFIKCSSPLSTWIIKNTNINVKGNGSLADTGYVFCNARYLHTTKENISNSHAHYQFDKTSYKTHRRDIPGLLLSSISKI